jgi:hypothetical protein
LKQNWPKRKANWPKRKRKRKKRAKKREAELEAQLAEERKKREELQTLPKTLPPLGPRGGSSSTPSISDAHTNAKIHVPRARTKQFNIIPALISKIFQPVEVASQIRILSASKASGLPWGTEADICRYVCIVLEDLVIVLGLPLEIRQELAVLPLRPDIWVVVVQKRGLPVGVVEVKTPSSSSDPLNSPRLQARSMII